MEVKTDTLKMMLLSKKNFQKDLFFKEHSWSWRSLYLTFYIIDHSACEKQVKNFWISKY